jgi:hypothetical protein
MPASIAALSASSTVNVESDGWRFSWNALYTLPPQWTVQGGYHAEFGPGASSRGFEAGVGYSPAKFLTVAVHGGALDRPLELRFDESSVRTYGLYAQYQPSSQLRVELMPAATTRTGSARTPRRSAGTRYG